MCIRDRANTARQFNKRREDILLHPALGLGMKLRDETMTVQYDTMPREAVSLEIERGGMSEELRVLYVAMTRAKEKLVMLTSLDDPVKTLGKLGAQLTDSKAISPYVVRSAGSFSDWILSCLLYTSHWFSAPWNVFRAAIGPTSFSVC